jgi:hypothetical protein
LIRIRGKHFYVTIKKKINELTKKMTRIKSANSYREFIKDFIKRDDSDQIFPPESFDILIENQGRWKSYRFVYESETKWCQKQKQVDDILRKNKHTPLKPYAEGRTTLGPQNGEH